MKRVFTGTPSIEFTEETIEENVGNGNGAEYVKIQCVLILFCEDKGKGFIRKTDLRSLSGFRFSVEASVYE